MKKPQNHKPQNQLQKARTNKEKLHENGTKACAKRRSFAVSNSNDFCATQVRQ